MMAHRAAAAALEASLKNEAADEFEVHGARVSWEWPGAGSVVASLNHDAVIVTDEKAFLEWLSLTKPHQVIRECRLVVINQKWLQEIFLTSLAPFVGEPGVPDHRNPEDLLALLQPGERMATFDPETGAVVPGVRWVKGGGLRSVSVKADSSTTRRLNFAAADYAAGAGLDQLGITMGESSGRANQGEHGAVSEGDSRAE
jgi:hypothetical protein